MGRVVNTWHPCVPDAGQTVSHSYEVLTNATARLKEILEKKLEDAVEAEHIPSMQRYWADLP